ERAFVVGLERRDAEIERLAQREEAPVDGSERLLAVEIRLPPAEQPEVRTVQNPDVARDLATPFRPADGSRSRTRSCSLRRPGPERAGPPSADDSRRSLRARRGRPRRAPPHAPARARPGRDRCR